MSFLVPQVFIVYVLSYVTRLDPVNKILTDDPKRYNKLFYWMLLIYLICISGFRYGVGTDYWNYTEMYTDWVKPDDSLAEASDVGFNILIRVLQVITPNPQILFFVTSVIINICIISTIKRYSSKFELSTYFYITTFVYYATFNAVRQTLAIAIVFAGTKYLLKRDWRKYIIIVLLSSLIHQSTLIMIPVYFLVNHKFMSKFNIYICLVFLAAFIFYNGFLEALFNMIQGTNYAGYQDEMTATGEGANVLRFLVQLAPIVLVFFYNKSIIKDDDKEFNIMMNMSLLGMLFMLLSLRHWLFARLTTIFNLYYVFTLPKILDASSDKDMRRLLSFIIMACYFIFTYMLLRSGESNILPYRWTTQIF